jgi:hypothetical protein
MANILGSTTDQELEALRNMAVPLMARSMGSGSTTDQEFKAYRDAVMQMDKNQLMNYIDAVNQIQSAGDFSGESTNLETGATSGAVENIGSSPLNPGATRGELDTAISTDEQNERNMRKLEMELYKQRTGEEFLTPYEEAYDVPFSGGYSGTTPTNLLLNIGRKAASGVRRSGRRGTAGEMRRTINPPPVVQSGLPEYFYEGEYPRNISPMMYPDPREPDAFPPEYPGTDPNAISNMLERRNRLRFQQEDDFGVVKP